MLGWFEGGVQLWLARAVEEIHTGLQVVYTDLPRSQLVCTSGWCQLCRFCFRLLEGLEV